MTQELPELLNPLHQGNQGPIKKKYLRQLGWKQLHHIAGFESLQLQNASCQYWAACILLGAVGS